MLKLAKIIIITYSKLSFSSGRNIFASCKKAIDTKARNIIEKISNMIHYTKIVEIRKNYTLKANLRYRKRFSFEFTILVVLIRITPTKLISVSVNIIGAIAIL